MGRWGRGTDLCCLLRVVRDDVAVDLLRLSEELRVSRLQLLRVRRVVAHEVRLKRGESARRASTNAVGVLRVVTPIV